MFVLSLLPPHFLLLGVIDEDMDLSQGKSEVPTGAPLQIMTQFLRAVSESRMVDALALAQTSKILRKICTVSSLGGELKLPACLE